jgi:hypothetical protein
MKKVFLLVASALLTMGSAQAISNPTYTVGENSFRVVQWDCENQEFASSNEFEFDETFVFAIDVSDNTALVSWIASPDAGVTRSVAANIFAGAELQGIDLRLFHLQDNIYGATINLKQLALARGKGLVKDDLGNSADAVGQFTSFSGNFFGWGYDASGVSGIGWYTSPYPSPVNDIFSTLEYTGGKTSPEFAYSNSPKLNDESSPLTKGFEKPCLLGTGIGDVTADGKVITGYYTILGVQLDKEPASGIFIEKYSDGTSAKIVK